MADSSVLAAAHILFSINGNLSHNSSTPASVQVDKVISWVTFIIGLPATGLAIYTLRNLSKGERKVPMHMTLLLISDIISFLGRPAVDQTLQEDTVFSSSVTDFIFYFGVVSNVSLMLFIAQEHHLLVAYPQCINSCRSVGNSRVRALILWTVPFVVLALAVLRFTLWFAVALLAPFPFLLFFTVDSCRALVCSRSNRPTPERRRAVWGISAIWANYTILYLPFILNLLLEALSFKEAVRYLGLVSHFLLYLSPLVDPFLYIFMTQGPREVLKALPCCNNTGQTEHRGSTVDTVAQTVDTRL